MFNKSILYELSIVLVTIIFTLLEGFTICLTWEACSMEDVGIWWKIPLVIISFNFVLVVFLVWRVIVDKLFNKYSI